MLEAQLDDVTGGMAKCSCGNFAHVPAAYKFQTDVSGLAIHSGVRVPIAEFGDWMLCHSSFRTPKGELNPDTEVHGSYGLWAKCAGCDYLYASTVLAGYHMIDPEGLFGGARVMMNVHSDKSARDVSALSNRKCPECGHSDLYALMVDIPKYVRDAFNTAKKRRSK